MTDEELRELVANLREAETDTSDLEVKRAREGLPTSLTDTLSSFSNTPGGGVIVLGIDEASGFSPVGVPQPKMTQSKVMSMCANSMEPPVRALIEIHRFEGCQVVTVEVPELEASHKPCFYKGAGRLNGSFRRVGDGDFRMSPYEVHMMLASRGHPRDDDGAR